MAYMTWRIDFSVNIFGHFDVSKWNFYSSSLRLFLLECHI